MTLEPDTGRRETLLAGFYAIYLRHCGYDADEAAILVCRRYPRVRWLQKLASGADREEQEQAAAAAGGAA